jgi:PAS domain S-box-containing protein
VLQVLRSFGRQTRLRSIPIAFGASLAAALVRQVCLTYFEIRTPLLILHVAAVAFVSQYCGTVAGLIATAASVVLIRVQQAADLPDPVTFAVFAVLGTALSIFGGRRLRAEQALRKAHERIALKHEVARIGTFEWFVQENRVEWSPEMARILGIESADRRRTFEEWKSVIHPDDVAQTVWAVETAMRNRQPIDAACRIFRPDGSVLWLQARGRCDYDPAGRPIHMLGAAMDITELKRVEEERKILRGLLPTCAECKKIRDENGAWHAIETFITERSEARFSHGLCPGCSRAYMERLESDVSDSAG